MKNRRVKILLVSNVLWKHLLTRDDNQWKAHVVMEGFPEDGRVVDADFDWLHDRVGLKVESDTFDEVADGCICPYFTINVRSFVPEQPIAIG
jgi:hypothetical protein